MSLGKTPTMAAGLTQYPYNFRWIGKLIDWRRRRLPYLYLKP